MASSRRVMPTASILLLSLTWCWVAKSIRLNVSHIYGPNSPMLPANCDDACVSQHRIRRFSTLIEGGVTQSPAGGSEYYVELSAGTPTQPIYLYLDTGSDFPWFQCQLCYPCYTQPLPVFDGSLSSTHQFLVQGDFYCNLVQASLIALGADPVNCLYTLQYGDGSVSIGHASSDTFVFDDLILEGVSFGCGTSNSVTVTGIESSGTLGLSAGQRGLSLPEQLGNFYGLGFSFSFCLPQMWSAPRSGFLVLGTGSQPAPQQYEGATGLLSYTPDGPGNSLYWYVSITNIIVNGIPVQGIDPNLLTVTTNTGRGGTIIDSGTAFSLLHINIYQPFRDAWRTAMQPLNLPGPYQGPFGLDTCYAFPVDLELPSVSFQFPEGSLLTPHEYNLYFFADASGQRQICWPYLIKPPSAPYGFLMGGITYQNIQMIFNVENAQLGWIYDEC